LRLDRSRDDPEISFSDKQLTVRLYPPAGNAAASAALRIPLLEEAHLPERFVILRGY